ncbi:MAG: hypothetical protein RSB67_01415 [Clostridia bacterium]
MNYLTVIKDMTKNKEKRTQNLVLLLVLIVILLIAGNYIFKTDTTKKGETSNSTSKDKNINSNSKGNVDTNTANINSNLENKLSNILSQISGISEVSALITYSQDSKKTPIYNTKELEKNSEKTTEKTVAYNEEGSGKKAIIETIEMPKIEGVIIVAKGANSVDTRSKIASAVSSITSVPIYKVQVFEKQG